ncbi:hypothetical protein ACFVVU_29120 [Kitasatospora sp. NPDC057965]|uniref:hypothetical protein n=1 Tax=Kitasatospora sp. NPDC057965 TaxID=3346291 RepID=UPI0036DEE660
MRRSGERAWYRNITGNPVVSVAVSGPDRRYRCPEVRGTVECVGLDPAEREQ